MAGHSKWANTKHRKGRADAKKGKIFSRIAKEIISAVKLAGPDPKANPRLRLALNKAKSANMPSDNVERNISKAANPDQSDFFELTYELYGHGGVAIVVEIMTDNKNRISSDMRIATNKRGGSVATPGSVLFNFDQKGVIKIDKSGTVEDQLFLDASEAGAEDFVPEELEYLIITEASRLFEVEEKLQNLNYKTTEASLQMIPKHFVECDDETLDSNLALIDWLEELSDVDAVYHNIKP